MLCFYLLLKGRSTARWLSASPRGVNPSPWIWAGVRAAPQPLGQQPLNTLTLTTPPSQRAARRAQDPRYKPDQGAGLGRKERRSGEARCLSSPSRSRGEARLPDRAGELRASAKLQLCPALLWSCWTRRRARPRRRGEEVRGGRGARRSCSGNGGAVVQHLHTWLGCKCHGRVRGVPLAAGPLRCWCASLSDLMHPVSRAGVWSSAGGGGMRGWGHRGNLRSPLRNLRSPLRAFAVTKQRLCRRTVLPHPLKGFWMTWEQDAGASCRSSPHGPAPAQTATEVMRRDREPWAPPALHRRRPQHGSGAFFPSSHALHPAGWSLGALHSSRGLISGNCIKLRNGARGVPAPRDGAECFLEGYR